MHILISSPMIRKELSKKLHNCCIEIMSFIEALETLLPTPIPLSVLKLATLHTLAYLLPLHKINIQVNGLITEARVIDNGTQIVVICKDLAQDIHTKINTAI